ncbi:MAG: alkaline phosphatase family protein [Alphaproteobacteria bacterium]|nr:alkaline phosphatase family protein [Alphaproteobacteria bacterium]MCB9699069.1 alkaline phosphatase family protein [Alphaproteobacteria bacterium]
MQRVILRAVALSVLAIGCRRSTPAPAVAAAVEEAAPAQAAPTLAVLIVVDQLPVRLLDTPRARYSAGLAKLTGPDAADDHAHYAHAITYTCPGHATISTGAAPSVNGIVSNDWWVPGDPGKDVYCGDPAFLRVPTLADRVMGAGGQVAAVSLKDRAAMMLGGPHANLVSWYDARLPGFTGPLEGAVDVTGWFREWTALYPEDYARWVGPDDSPIEHDPGIGTTFPHAPPVAKNFLVTPFAGDALVDAALAAVDRLGLGQQPGRHDLLAVSFSETDYVGHTFTAESWEAMDNMVRLDASLGRLLDGLGSRVGQDAFSVVLTSDHGSFVARDAVRIPQGAVERAADDALAAHGVAGKAHFEAPSLWLPRDTPAEAALAAAAAVSQVPGIAGAWAWRVEAPEGPHAEAVRLSLDEERSGDIYVLRGEHALFDYPGSEGQGTSHGTPFAEDTEVPLLAWGAGVHPERGVTYDVRQVAPTVAALLGLPGPDAATLPPAEGIVGR